MKNGKAFLIDFGIARAFIPEQTLTAIGTDGYAAPEQRRGNAEPKSDLYSLGVVLYYLLTGNDPQISPLKKPVKLLIGTVPQQCANLIASLLENEPENRPASANEVRKILRSVMESKGQGAIRASGPSPESLIKKYGTIFKAADAGDCEAVKAFIGKGVDVNAAGDDGETPLHRACENGHKEVVEILLIFGADVNAGTGSYKTPLHEACRAGHKERHLPALQQQGIAPISFRF